MELSTVGRINNWELLWSTYDEPTYQDVLAHIKLDDIVLEIGAGDFRLAKRIARQALRVYGIEINKKMAACAKKAVQLDNLELICADAYHYPFPQGITLAVLLMRHCRNFQLIWDKLLAVGCERLVTNARWGLGVELIDLAAERVPYELVPFGWYACWCGNVGFVEGPAKQLVAETESIVHEVWNCPAC